MMEKYEETGDQILSFYKLGYEIFKFKVFVLPQAIGFKMG